MGAELLSGYGPSTGHWDQVLLAMAFFAALYGAPALLVREVARRRRWGWPSLLLMMTALAVTQCCVIDQSLFSATYQGYDGWQQAREATWVPWLTTSAYNASNFVLGHVIFSFAAPIAVAEAWRPEREGGAWLNSWAIAAALISYLTAAVMIVSDAQSRSATPLQLGFSAGVITALLGAAMLCRNKFGGSAGMTLRPIGVTIVALAAFACGAVVECAPSNWGGVAIYLSATAAGSVVLWRVSASRTWTCRHGAAVGCGLLAARGLLAIVGEPVSGEVEVALKYTHNAVMLVVVLVAGWYALRPRKTLATR